MLDRLWFKLTGAFALVTVVGVLVTVVLARQGTTTQFAHLMIDHHMVRPERLLEALATYYSEHGDWLALDAQLPVVVEVASEGVMSDMMGSMMGMHENRVQVIDPAGAVVADTHGPGDRQPLTSQPEGHTGQSWPIVLGDMQVGELLVAGSLMVGASARNESLVAGVTRSILLAGLTAGLVGLLLATLFVRQITRPLGSLSVASRQIAQGDLSVRVPVHGKDELGEVAITFNQMATSLETQAGVRRKLMADIAHELRTPLAGIQGTVEALQDGVFPVSQENLQAVHDQVMLLSRLVEDLRTLANAEAGDLSLNRLPLDLAELCQRQVTALQPQAVAKQVDLSVQVEGVSATICGDEQRLGQVLNNLLDNALRHTPAGGRVQLRLSLANGMAQLAVVDDGEGLAPADLPRIFDRSFRAEHAHKRSRGGSGLGLAIARQLVQAHGGRIWAESPPPGQSCGAALLVTLPLAS